MSCFITCRCKRKAQGLILCAFFGHIRKAVFRIAGYPGQAGSRPRYGKLYFPNSQPVSKEALFSKFHLNRFRRLGNIPSSAVRRIISSISCLEVSGLSRCHHRMEVRILEAIIREKYRDSFCCRTAFGKI